MRKYLVAIEEWLFGGMTMEELKKTRRFLMVGVVVLFLLLGWNLLGGGR